jgi:hypothetical protein
MDEEFFDVYGDDMFERDFEYDDLALDNLEDQYEDGDHFRDDVEADADVLRSAGMGTDEDYGYYEFDENF